MTRGIKHEVDRTIIDLQGKYFPMKYKGQNIGVQLGVRPIQLWELVLPEDQLPVLQNTLWRTGEPDVKRFSKQLTAMRLGLGASKMPKLDPKKGRQPCYVKDIAIYPIGIKKDAYNEDGEVL